MTPLPFLRSYWVEPHRLLAGFLPGDSDPVQAHAKLSALAGCGVTHVINLMEESEKDHSGRLFTDYRSALFDTAAKRGYQIGWTRRAIPDLGVPEVPEMSTTLDILDASMNNGCAYVHCWGGRGRTGTVLGCWLARHGVVSGDAVMERLRQLTAHNRAAFPCIPETPVQQKFVHQWKKGM